MRAYLSFVLVLFSLMLLFSIMQFNDYSNSRNVIDERAYLVSMNAKEAVIESLRQGAAEGFKSYDSAYKLENCACCPPCHPKLCDPGKCQYCFRESEAMESARRSALLQLDILRLHDFDDDFNVSFSGADIRAFSRAEPASNNGFALDSIRVNKDLAISISSGKFALDGHARIPGGTIIHAGHD